MHSKGQSSLGLEFSNTLFYLLSGGAVTKAWLLCAAVKLPPAPLRAIRATLQHGNGQQIASS